MAKPMLHNEIVRRAKKQHQARYVRDHVLANVAQDSLVRVLVTESKKHEMKCMSLVEFFALPVFG